MPSTHDYIDDKRNNNIQSDAIHIDENKSSENTSKEAAE